eukprot:g5349.t1
MCLVLAPLERTASLRCCQQLRRRGLGNALLQRALAELRAAAKASPSFLGEETKDTALRVVECAMENIIT